MDAFRSRLVKMFHAAMVVLLLFSSSPVPTLARDMVESGGEAGNAAPPSWPLAALAAMPTDVSESVLVSVPPTMLTPAGTPSLVPARTPGTTYLETKFVQIEELESSDVNRDGAAVAMELSQPGELQLGGRSALLCQAAPTVPSMPALEPEARPMPPAPTGPSPLDRELGLVQFPSVRHAPVVPLQQSGTVAALAFDGNDDYVNIGDAIEPNYFSIEAWVEPNGDQAATHVVSKYAGVPAEYQLGIAQASHGGQYFIRADSSAASNYAYDSNFAQKSGGIKSTPAL